MYAHGREHQRATFPGERLFYDEGGKKLQRASGVNPEARWTYY